MSETLFDDWTPGDPLAPEPHSRYRRNHGTGVGWIRPIFEVCGTGEDFPEPGVPDAARWPVPFECHEIGAEVAAEVGGDRR